MATSHDIMMDNIRHFLETKVVKYPVTGLCDNLQLTNTAMDTFSSWKHFSGDLVFPVPATDEGLTALDQYYTSGLYTGEQLELRLSLARHILKELEK